MKHITKSTLLRAFVIISLLLLRGNYSYAQYYMNVFRNDGARVQYDVTIIDSVSFRLTNSQYLFDVYAKYVYEPVTTFFTNQVDSISYGPFITDNTVNDEDEVTVTGQVTNIAPYSATIFSWANVLDNYSSDIQIGVIYCTTGTPNKNNGERRNISKSSINSDASFYINVTGLAPSTTYYYRSYVYMSGMWFYGQIKSFTTEKSVFYLNSGEASKITCYSAKVSGELKVDNINSYTNLYYGICYSADTIPIINYDDPNSRTRSAYANDINSEGVFNSQLRALTGSTTYYYRSFAEINEYKYYGPVRSFTTVPDDVVLTGEIDSTNYQIKSTLKIGSGAYSTLELGVCYGTNEMPTINDQCIYATEIDDDKNFITTLKSIPNGVVYYRAFVKIDGIPHYGEIKSFTSNYKDVIILSGPISGFQEDGIATIKLRTIPYDLPLNGVESKISVFDTLGNWVGGKMWVQSSEFMPDTTWVIKVKIEDSTIEDTIIVLSLTGPTYSLKTTAIRLMKVSFKMTAVRVDNSQMTFDSQTNTYSYCLPTTTDFSNIRFKFTHSGEKVTVGDSVLLDNQYNILDASKPIIITVWKYNVKQDYTIKVYNTGLPVVRIDTNGSSVTRRDTWVSNSTMRIELPDGTVNYEGTLNLKGRGYGTWTESNKKPYALKLDEKAKILGMHKQKNWVLLANYKDRTLLRNDAAFWLSRNTEMPYTVEGKYVELVWNGKHMGNYYLCEQARIDNHRIDIKKPNLAEPEKGGYFMEIETYLNYSSPDMADRNPEVGFVSSGANSRYKLPYIFKSPEEDENGVLLSSSSPAYQYMRSYVNEMETAIYNASSSNHEWMNYLDMDRAIDYALIQEITMNPDSYNTWPSNGPHNAYLYKDSCGLMCYGPVWDFDYHTFTLYNDAAYGSPSSSENPRLYQWELLKMDNKGNNKYYFADLVKKDPMFKMRLLERWNMYKNIWKEGFPAYIDEMADKIRLSESYNIQIWSENTSLSGYKQNGDYNLTFQQAVEALKTAFLKRWEWIDANISNL